MGWKRRLAIGGYGACASVCVWIGIVESCWESRARYDVRQDNSFADGAGCATRHETEEETVPMSSRIPNKRRPCVRVM
jgi:hypothetical protein